MLPILYRFTLPAGFAVPLAALLALVLLLSRAVSLRRYERRQGRTMAFVAALWDDKVTVAILLVLLLGVWKSGLLGGRVVVPLHSYGVLIALGAVVGVTLAQREARRKGQNPDRIIDLALWILLAAVLGAHLYYAAVNHELFFSPATWLVESPLYRKVLSALTFGRLDVPRVPRVLVLEGAVFYGGFLGAALAAWLYMARHKMPFFPHADTLVPSVAMGHFFGRLGCFGAGCCWGEVGHAHLPWLVKFPADSLAYQMLRMRPDGQAFLDGTATLPLHPTQLYEALGELALFFVLVLVVRPRQRFQGQVLAVWLVLYALLRTSVEFFRGDVERGVVAGLGVGQWTSAAILAAGVAVWVVGSRRRSAGAAAAAA